MSLDERHADVPFCALAMPGIPNLVKQHKHSVRKIASVNYLSMCHSHPKSGSTVSRYCYI